MARAKKEMEVAEVVEVVEVAEVEETLVEDEKAKTDGKVSKQIKWKYMLGGHTLTVDFPAGENFEAASKDFHLEFLVKDLSPTQELIMQYGVKQWLSDKYASIKDLADKWESLSINFNDLREKGLELSDGGSKISIVGKERANANVNGVKAQLASAKAELLKSNSMLELMTKKLSGIELTEAEETTLKGMMERVAEQK